MLSMRQTLLSFSAGYVDAAGFLALGGLFTAHVTGNFVTMGSVIVHGGSGLAAKLLALPVFCLAVALARFLVGDHPRSLVILLVAESALLALGCTILIALAPMDDGDAPASIAGGMLLVAAMAMQNAAQRLHLADQPPSTLMTGTTTQLLLDVADHMRKAPKPDERRARMGRLGAALASFAVGCIAAAVAIRTGGMWCFAIPPLLSLAVLALSVERETGKRP